MTEPLNFSSNTVAFVEKLGKSPAFKELYKEGMALVEEAAQYLDGQGRKEAKDLPRVGALTYATESMRLTTRLMQMASWLLLQRALAEGEMSVAEAQEERKRMVLPQAMNVRSDELVAELPQALLDLIERSHAVFMRIRKLDAMLSEEPGRDVPVDNPVENQLSALRSAFGALSE